MAEPSSLANCELCRASSSGVLEKSIVERKNIFLFFVFSSKA
jgi:hypothetical protein